MRYLIIIPGAIFGFMVGVLVGMLLGMVAILLWWGPNAFEHPDLIAYMMRPAGVVGAIIGAATSAVAILR